MTLKGRQGVSPGQAVEKTLLKISSHRNTPDEKKDKIYRQTHIDGGTYIFDYAIAGGSITETTMTAPNGAATAWRFYDDSGNFYDKYIVRRTTPEGATVYNREIGTNLMTSVTDPLGREMNYTYYPNGQAETITDNLGNVTRYENTGKPSELTKIIGPSPINGTTTMTYDVFGRLWTVTDANNKTTEYSYDEHGGRGMSCKCVHWTHFFH